MNFYFGRAALRPVVLTLALLAVVPAQGQDAAVKQAQDALGSWGYLNSTADGMLGPATRVALRDFQRNLGLPVTGELDAATARALSVDLPAPVQVPSTDLTPLTIPADAPETTAQTETAPPSVPRITPAAQPPTPEQTAPTSPAGKENPGLAAILLIIAVLIFLAWLAIRCIQ